MVTALTGKATDLAISGLTKVFGVSTAVDGVTLRIHTGEMVALLGPSGCGKTTLLRLIAGFNRPTAGAIRIAGRTVASPTVMVPPEKRSLSMVFQSYAVWPHKTVFENLAYGLRLRHLDAAMITAKVKDALATVRMEAYGVRYPGELSGGQQQRVAVARALVSRPDLMFADEPTGNLDSKSGAEILSFMRDAVTDLHQTIVMVTHDPIAASYADRVVFLADGAIVGELLEPNTDAIIDKMKSLGG